MNEEFSGAYESIMESLDTGTMYGEGILEQLGMLIIKLSTTAGN